MTKNYLMVAPVGLCLLAALASACLEEKGGDASALKSANASDATFTVTDMSDGVCENPRCFKVTSSKELSFIAVDTSCPTATGIILDLYHYVNGTLVKVNASPVPHGVGDPCSADGITIPADALKFEGLTDPEYLVCVTFEGVNDGGSVDIYAKAGTSCVEKDFNDCMCSSTETSGAGGTSGVGGAGTGGAGTGGAGAGGAGGAGTGGAGTGAGGASTGGAGGAGGCDCDWCDGSGGWWGGSGGGGGWWGGGGWCGGCGCD